MQSTLLKDNDSDGDGDETKRKTETNTTTCCWNPREWDKAKNRRVDAQTRGMRHGTWARGRAGPSRALRIRAEAGGHGRGAGEGEWLSLLCGGGHHIERFGSVVLREVGTVPPSPLLHTHPREEGKERTTKEKEHTHTHTQSHSRYRGSQSRGALLRGKGDTLKPGSPQALGDTATRVPADTGWARAGEGQRRGLHGA